MISLALKKNVSNYYYEFDIEQGLRIWRPCTTAIIPCILWNHGSRGDGHLFGSMDDGTTPPFVESYLKMGIAVFMFSRMGYNGVKGLSLEEQLKPFSHDREQCDISLVKILKDGYKQILRHRKLMYNYKWVAQDKVICAGYSLGAILALLAVDKINSFCAGIAFSPGAMMWEKFNKVRQLILKTAMGIKIPLMIIQAKNDYSVSPAIELNKILMKNKSLSQVLIYQQHGINAAQAHNFFNSGAKIWHNDVALFLKRILVIPE